MKADYIIVGSGLTGAVIARHLADAGRSVVVLDRRSRPGGNVADTRHTSGILVHQYGPHYFRTVSRKIWKFVNRFSDFYPYRQQVKSIVDGQLENWPIAASFIRRLCGDDWKPAISNGRPDNFEEAALSIMPRVIYEKFVKGYTEKQWGVPAKQLAASLCQRFDVREDDCPYLTPNAKYQGLPAAGYSVMMSRMLEGIPLVLDRDYLASRDEFKARKMVIYTGPIDEYFGFELGSLAYRGQKREHQYMADVDFQFPVAVLNNPGEGEHIRDIEWKHMMEVNCCSGTLITRETPWFPKLPDGYEYPFPDEANQKLYLKYREIADKETNLLICGRLGEYRYYDMDHAIAKAMTLSRKLLSGNGTCN